MSTTSSETSGGESHPVLPPSKRNQMELLESPEQLFRANRSRSASHPLKMALLTARRVFRSQFGDSDSFEDLRTSGNLPASSAVDLNPSIPDSYHTTPRSQKAKPNLSLAPSSLETSGNSYVPYLPPLPPLPKAQILPNYSKQACAEITLESAKLNLALSPSTKNKIPVRPARSSFVDPDLVPQITLPVIVSPVANQLARKKKHRRRWTSRSKGLNLGSSSESIPFNVTLSNRKAFNSLQKSDSISSCSETDLMANNLEDQSFTDSCMKLDSSTPFFPFTSDNTDASHPGIASFTECSYADGREEFEMEDLTTPTLKSCETFVEENLITPCQTRYTPTCAKIERQVPMTPRMIFEEFQRQFNQEDLMIKSKDLKALQISADHVSQHSKEDIPAPIVPIESVHDTSACNIDAATQINSPDLNRNEPCQKNQGTSRDNGEKDSSKISPANDSWHDAPWIDPADESFESFGEDQLFGPLLSDGSNPIPKGKIPLIDTFPLPPVTRSPIVGINTQRTPPPRLTPGERLSITTRGGVEPRIPSDPNRMRVGKLRPASLIFGNLLPTNTTSKEGKTLSMECSPSLINQEIIDFERHPSPYRHVASESKDHNSPDHLESSTRLMRMFEVYLENSPKTNSSGRSPTSSISNKPSRKFKLQDSPLKKFGDFRLPETPKQGLQARQPHLKADLGKSSHRTYPNAGCVSRSSGLSCQLHTDDNSKESKSPFQSALDSSPARKGVLLSPDMCACQTEEEKTTDFLISSDEHASPFSDSDAGHGHSPRTPFGDFFHRPTALDSCPPKLDRILTRGGLIQHISLEAFRPNDPTNDLPKLHNSLHSTENFYHTSKNIETPSSHGLPGPQLRQMRSISKISSMADGLLSRISHQRFSKDSVLSSKVEAKPEQPLGTNSPRTLNIIKSPDSSPRTSSWSSTIPEGLILSVSTSPLKNQPNDPARGRILNEELNNEEGEILVLKDPMTLTSPKQKSAEFDGLGSYIDVAGSPDNTTLMEGFAIKGKHSQLLSESLRKRGGKILKRQDESILVEEGPSSSLEVLINRAELDSALNHIISPIRLYGKQQGILETGQWKKNNLNFQSMKSQYEFNTANQDSNGGLTSVNHSNEDERCQTSTIRGKSRSVKATALVTTEEKLTEEEQKEKNESLIVYKIQEEDDNQIKNFEINRLKKIFYNKSLKASKSKSKLSSKSSMKFF